MSNFRLTNHSQIPEEKLRLVINANGMRPCEKVLLELLTECEKRREK